MRLRWPIAAVLFSAFALTGCLQPPPYSCQTDSVCVLNEVQGMCRLDSNTCVYPAPAIDCPSMWRDAQGNCVAGTAGDGTSTGDDTSVATQSSSETTTPDPSTSTSTGDGVSAGSTTTGATTMTMSSSETGSGVDCSGPANQSNITSLGVVGASTVFSGYPPGLSVDGDLATSWFSSGPEGPDVPSIFNWTLGEAHCISQLFISGNGLNANSSFREGFGFGRVTFRILDASNDVVFEEQRLLPGTPDPDVMVDVPDVMGTRVVLELYEHESEDCGGFSELQVLGQ